MLERVIRYRILVIALYAALLPLAILSAMHIPKEGGLDQLIVPDDPDLEATRAFQAIFPEPQLVLVVFESPDPWAPEALAKVARAKATLAAAPHIHPFSVIEALSRARPNAPPDELRKLATGSAFFRQQGLVGDHFLTVIAALDAHDAAERDAALAVIDRVLAEGGPDVHAIGAPIVSSWLEHQSSHSTARAFGLFGVLMVLVIVFLYRSLRALLAIVLSLGTTVALAVGAGGLLGFAFTIVSGLVPLAIMVTTLATLTYLHSRFIDQPEEDTSFEEHQLFALRNKRLPIVASTVAAAAGFAALAVSHILPIREMGLWTAVGLGISLCVSYTLFPALQRVLRTPTSRRVAVRSAAYDRIARGIPSFTFKHRRLLLAIAGAFGLAGVISLVGIPHVLRPMPVRIDALSNLDPASRVYHDMRWFRDNVMDLNVARVWIHLPKAMASDPEVLHAIDRFETALDSVPRVTGVAGPTTPLRMRSYLTGHGERLPEDPDQFADTVADVEQLMLTEPDLRAFIDVGTLKDFQIVVLFRDGGAEGYAELAAAIDEAWVPIAADPALAGAELHVVGEARLQAKIGADLIPTLAESFALTAAFIFIVFVVIFRSGTERLLAMIPSVLALLVTFLGLRLAGGALDVATILIATTVLGTTENDQLHFFHHMHESPDQSTEGKLRHTLRIAGRAVVFATLINAIGFLGLATSSFPPLRHFGVLTASAFVIALVADLVVLPAALWVVSRRRAKPQSSS